MKKYGELIKLTNRIDIRTISEWINTDRCFESIYLSDEWMVLTKWRSSPCWSIHQRRQSLSSFALQILSRTKALHCGDMPRVCLRTQKRRGSLQIFRRFATYGSFSGNRLKIVRIKQSTCDLRHEVRIHASYYTSPPVQNFRIRFYRRGPGSWTKKFILRSFLP